MRALLLGVGFDAAHPNPALAWEAFKQFVAEPVDAATTELWFEAGDGDPEKGYPAYFDFVRMFSHDEDDGADWGEQITVHFTAEPSVRLGLRSGSVQAKNVADLQTWFGAVEASQSFKVGSGFAGWAFEVRIDGC